MATRGEVRAARRAGPILLEVRVLGPEQCTVGSCTRQEDAVRHRRLRRRAELSSIKGEEIRERNEPTSPHRSDDG